MLFSRASVGGVCEGELEDAGMRRGRMGVEVFTLGRVARGLLCGVAETCVVLSASGEGVRSTLRILSGGGSRLDCGHVRCFACRMVHEGRVFGLSSP